MHVCLDRRGLVAFALAVALAGCKEPAAETPPARPGTTKPDPTSPPIPTSKPATGMAATSPGSAAVPTKPSGSVFEVHDFYGLRVPAGGMGGRPPQGGKGMAIIGYKLDREVLSKALETQLAADGWTTVKRELSPRRSLRLKIAKGGNLLDVRVAGGPGRAAIIVFKMVPKK